MLRYATPFHSRRLGKTIKQVSKPQARKAYEAGNTVYLLACNMIVDGWMNSFCSINKADAVEVERTFDYHVHDYKYYNCHGEYGSYPIFFIETTE